MFDVSFSLNPLDNNDISQCSNFETLSQSGHRRDTVGTECLTKNVCYVQLKLINPDRILVFLVIVFRNWLVAWTLFY